MSLQKRRDKKSVTFSQRERTPLLLTFVHCIPQLRRMRESYVKMKLRVDASRRACQTSINHPNFSLPPSTTNPPAHSTVQERRPFNPIPSPVSPFIPLFDPVPLGHNRLDFTCAVPARSLLLDGNCASTVDVHKLTIQELEGYLAGYWGKKCNIPR